MIYEGGVGLIHCGLPGDFSNVFFFFLKNAGELYEDIVKIFDEDLVIGVFAVLFMYQSGGRM